MLCLLFELQADRFVLDTSYVAEVLPLVTLVTMPQAPRGVAGIFDYRGTPVPAIDLSVLMLERPARAALSTRLIVVNYPLADGQTRWLGLIAERTTSTIRKPRAEFVSSGVRAHGAPYLGPVATDAQGILQLVELPALLPATLRDVLFTPPIEA